jgi:hypothetical protein
MLGSALFEKECLACIRRQNDGRCQKSKTENEPKFHRTIVSETLCGQGSLPTILMKYA